MDGNDKKIIELLQQDGRLEDVEIARKVGISHDTVKRRRNKLEDAGYIKIQANINPRKLGYTSVFILGITLAPGIDIRKIAGKLASKKEFLWCFPSYSFHSCFMLCPGSDNSQ